MRILVFIKQVPYKESSPEISPDSSAIIFPANTAYCINSFDEYALEEALLIAETMPETVVDVVTIGPPSAEASLRRALAMGAHNAYHYVAAHADAMTSMEKAEVLAAFAQSRPFDIIFAGVMSEDSAHAAVGAMVACRLGIPWATHIISLKTNTDAKMITVEREIDVSTRQIITLPLPALITVQSGINRPRYPSLSNTLRAKKQPIEHFNLPENVITQKSRFSFPVRSKQTLMLQGTTEENARALYEYLHAKSFLGAGR